MFEQLNLHDLFLTCEHISQRLVTRQHDNAMPWGFHHPGDPPAMIPHRVFFFMFLSVHTQCIYIYNYTYIYTYIIIPIIILRLQFTLFWAWATQGVCG